MPRVHSRGCRDPGKHENKVVWFAGSSARTALASQALRAAPICSKLYIEAYTLPCADSQFLNTCLQNDLSTEHMAAVRWLNMLC